MRLRLAAMMIYLTSASAMADAPYTTWIELRALEEAELTTLLESSTSPTIRSRARLTLADRALNQSADTAALLLSQSASELDPLSPDAELLGILQCQLNHRASVADSDAACSRFKRPGYESSDPFIQSYLHSTLAYLYYREGKHDRSIAQAQKTLTTAQALGDSGLLATAHNLAGLHFSTSLLPRMALPHFEAAWEHAGLLAYPQLKHIVQMNLASNYSSLQRSGEALRLLNEVAQSPAATIYPSRRIVVQSMISQAHAALGNAAQAEQEMQRVLNADGSSVLPDTATFGYQGLGVAQIALGRPKHALASFQKILDLTGRTLESGLEHPRVQLVLVPYARALRLSGEPDAAISLLRSAIATISKDQPDQLLLDATSELATALSVAGDSSGATIARAQAEVTREQLWDASFRYRLARLNQTMEADRQQEQQVRAETREGELRAAAKREAALKHQSWVIGAMLIALIVLLQSRRLQKRVAATEREANERLEDLVKQRTEALEDEMAVRLRSEVQQRELIDKLAEAEKLRVMGQLTAGVAHDFNNLMTVVTLAAEHLGTKPETIRTDDEFEMIKNILSAADTGAKITDGLLAYVRKQPLQPQTLQLGTFLESSMPLFQNTLGAQLQLKAEIEHCAVLVDESQLTTALINLLLNAKESMTDNGELLLVAKVSANQATISLQDNGKGMSEASLRRACEPFFTTKTAGEGTGLGLSMVDGFVRQSGGDIQIESEPGVGTKVSITLPLATTHHAVTQPKALSKGTLQRTKRVLVVEDREALLSMLEQALAKSGLTVSAVASADRALEHIDEHGLPDLLITDIVMPGSIDGFKLAKQLRQLKRDLAVILISGYSDGPHDEHIFLPKPFSMAQLEHCIQQAFEEVSVVARLPVEP